MTFDFLAVDLLWVMVSGTFLAILLSLFYDINPWRYALAFSILSLILFTIWVGVRL